MPLPENKLIHPWTVIHLTVCMCSQTSFKIVAWTKQTWTKHHNIAATVNKLTHSQTSGSWCSGCETVSCKAFTRPHLLSKFCCFCDIFLNHDKLKKSLLAMDIFKLHFCCMLITHDKTCTIVFRKNLLFKTRKNLAKTKMSLRTILHHIWTFWGKIW